VLRPGAFSLCCALLLTPHPAGLWAQIALERLPEVSDATTANDPPPVPPDFELEVQSLRYPTADEPNANCEGGVNDHRVPSGVDRRWIWNPPSTTHPLPRMEPVTEGAMRHGAGDAPSPLGAIKTPGSGRSQAATVVPPVSTGNSLRFVLPPTSATSEESR
jgi:hypothetical protein